MLLITCKLFTKRTHAGLMVLVDCSYQTSSTRNETKYKKFPSFPNRKYDVCSTKNNCWCCWVTLNIGRSKSDTEDTCEMIKYNLEISSALGLKRVFENWMRLKLTSLSLIKRKIKLENFRFIVRSIILNHSINFKVTYEYQLSKGITIFMLMDSALLLMFQISRLFSRIQLYFLCFVSLVSSPGTSSIQTQMTLTSQIHGRVWDGMAMIPNWALDGGTRGVASAGMVIRLTKFTTAPRDRFD